MNVRSISLVMSLLVAVLLTVTAAHAQDNTLKFKLKPGASGTLCLKCHVATQETVKKPFVHTPLKTGDCAGCHNPHTSSHGKLLAKETVNICSLCHSSVIPKDARSAHKVVAEGGCMKCHDPHAATNKFNLVKGGNDLCFGCHKAMGETLAKVKFKHSPVGKGCLTCHDPHASAQNGFLLRNAVPVLCVGCHKTDKPVFIKAHMNYPVANSRCTSCHDPHGSDVAGILYNTVHKPIASKMCNQCHEEPSSPTPLKVKRSGTDLCKGCHSAMVNQTFGRNRIHWPLLSREGCLTCHGPHASKQKGLLKQDTLTLCGSCHKDTITRQEKSMTKHAPVMAGDCAACHDAHAADGVYLFKQASIVDLCGKCHDWQKHSTHPLGEKVRDPRSRSLSVQCLSCHRSHGTEYKHFIPFATTTELCTQCHENFKR